MFFKGSRYAKIPRLSIVDDSGRAIIYTAARLIPDTPAMVGHRVVQGERLDQIAWAQYRDPERFWRICDANLALWPGDLLEPGDVINIPPSET
jgi:nucleoid-associated protein YgaU